MSSQNSSVLRRQPAQQRAQQSLDSILDSASALIGQQGVDGFSMAELARRAGMSKPALYRYFPNKQAIIQELARCCFDENSQLLAPGNLSERLEKSAIRAALARYCQLQKEQPFRVQLRAAIKADPELMALDLADSRRNAAFACDYLLALDPARNREQLQVQMLLLIGGADEMACLTTQVSEAEAERLIDAYADICFSVMRGER